MRRRSGRGGDPVVDVWGARYAAVVPVVAQRTGVARHCGRGAPVARPGARIRPRGLPHRHLAGGSRHHRCAAAFACKTPEAHSLAPRHFSWLSFCRRYTASREKLSRRPSW